MIAAGVPSDISNANNSKFRVYENGSVYGETFKLNNANVGIASSAEDEEDEETVVDDVVLWAGRDTNKWFAWGGISGFFFTKNNNFGSGDNIRLYLKPESGNFVIGTVTNNILYGKNTIREVRRLTIEFSGEFNGDRSATLYNFTNPRYLGMYEWCEVNSTSGSIPRFYTTALTPTSGTYIYDENNNRKGRITNVAIVARQNVDGYYFCDIWCSITTTDSSFIATGRYRVVHVSPSYVENDGWLDTTNWYVWTNKDTVVYTKKDYKSLIAAGSVKNNTPIDVYEKVGDAVPILNRQFFYYTNLYIGGSHVPNSNGGIAEFDANSKVYNVYTCSGNYYTLSKEGNAFFNITKDGTVNTENLLIGEELRASNANIGGWNISKTDAYGENVPELSSGMIMSPNVKGNNVWRMRIHPMDGIHMDNYGWDAKGLSSASTASNYMSMELAMERLSMRNPAGGWISELSQGNLTIGSFFSGKGGQMLFHNSGTLTIQPHTVTGYTTYIYATPSNSYSIDTEGYVLAMGYSNKSDDRLKDYKDDIENALDKSLLIPTKYFTWKKDENKRVEIGTSAQAVKKVFPEIVREGGDGMLTVEYDKLSIIAIAAIKELTKKIEALEERIKELEQTKN